MEFSAVAIVEVVPLMVLLSFVSTEDVLDRNPELECYSGQTINTTQVNDGVNDCDNNADEYDDPLLISVGCNRNQSSTYNFIEGYFIRSKREFRTSVSVCEYPSLLLPLELYGPYVYFVCEGQYDRVFRMNRNGSNLKNISLPGKNISSMAVDQITSNVYIIESGRIQMCDVELKMCSTLPELGNDTMSLAFSSEAGLLFWVERHLDTEWRIMSARRDGTSKRVVMRTRSPVKFVTVDQRNRKLYWLQLKPRKNIFSSNFLGRSRELMKSNSSLTDVQTFVVDGDGPENVYWSATSKPQVQACFIDEHGDVSAHNSNVGKNIVLYSGTRNIAPEKIRESEVCDDTRCSHLCTYISNTDYSCFCEDSVDHKVVNAHNGFCEGSTLVVVGSNNSVLPTSGSDERWYSGVESENELLLFGWTPLYESYLPLGRITLEDNSSISAITYDSVQGRLVYAVTGREEIYTYTLGQKEPELLVSSTGDEIKKLEFDDFGNNIYWISSSEGTVRVASCATRKTMIVFPKGIFVPFDFALAPDFGTIFILALGRLSTPSLFLKRFSMSGNAYPNELGETIHVFHFFDIGSLHYARNEQILLVTIPEEKVIYYVEVESLLSAPNFMDEKEGLFKKVQSLEESKFWSVADLRLRAYALVQQTNASILQVAAVIPAVESNYSECRTENGGCQHLCLMSNTVTSTTSNKNARRHKVCQCSPEDCPGQQSILEGIIPGASEEESNKTEFFSKLQSTTHPHTWQAPSSSEFADRTTECTLVGYVETTESSQRHQQMWRASSNSELLNRTNDPLLEGEQTYEPSVFTTSTEEAAKNRSDEKAQKTFKKGEPANDFYASPFPLLIITILCVCVIILLIAVFILCYFAIRSRGNSCQCESMRLKSYKPGQVNLY